MEVRPGTRSAAVALSLLAALLSSTYYILVLLISPGTRPAAILVYPFLTAGLAYAALSRTSSDRRAFLRVWTDPMAYVRTGLLVAYQLSVLAATFLIGPVDAALLTLIGDVAATPLVAAAIFRSSTPRIRVGWFAAGLVLSLAGGMLAILGGRSLSAVPPLGWIVVPAIPLTIAFFVLLTARANERAPTTAVVGQSTLGAGLLALAIAPAVPGGLPGLVVPDAAAWGILLVVGLVTLFAAPWLYFAAIQRTGPALPAVLMTGIPVFTSILSWGVLHLGLSWVALLGIPVAVVGGALALQGVTPDPSDAP